MITIRVRNPSADEVNRQLRQHAERNGQKIEVTSQVYNEQWTQHTLSMADSCDKDCATILFFLYFIEDYGYDNFDVVFVLT